MTSYGKFFKTYEDASLVLESMREGIKMYGHVSVADMYELAGWNSHYTDNEIGWTNLICASIDNTPSGWVLILPEPRELEPKRVKSTSTYNRPSTLPYHDKYRPEYVSKTPRFRRLPEIKDVIYNDPATIVFWADGTKTVVKCQEGYAFDPMSGLAMAICEKAFGSKANSHKVFNKWLPKEEINICDKTEIDLPFINEKAISILGGIKEMLNKYLEEENK